VTSDVYIDGGGGAEWYASVNNFMRQMRNFKIDMRDCDTDQIAAIHWQVAQGA
jgi:Pectate lyase superfamily protein